ncbi:TIR domain-containing protein [Syntrophus gentianae]|uniref:TIR domain-containing protein n=1 Tax=Syntrophus gentianae TaxID=43775 RepID=A0A1H7WIR3_9BACT|nr:toll/interleukin-1 receptor domain-containing protein [Syntrophus gentianae]SEM20919.1 TIR domain-containing protein [Syntrophus gentianae]
MTSRFSVFISHVSEDEAVAVMLKNSIERVFLNSDVFVSGRDLKGGEIWIKEIREKLRQSSVIIALVTEFSRDSNWVLFEAGSGFIENKSIPLCVPPLLISNLTPPLSLLQAREYNKEGLKKILQDIANVTGLRIPQEIPGISEEIAELKKYLSLRNKGTDEKRAVGPNNVPSNKRGKVCKEDADIKSKISEIERRLKEFLISQLLTVDPTYEIPRKQDLDTMKLNELGEIARYANIPFDFFILARLGIEAMSVPTSDSPEWTKQNRIKGLESIIKDMSKYIKGGNI